MDSTSSPRKSQPPDQKLNVAGKPRTLLRGQRIYVSGSTEPVLLLADVLVDAEVEVYDPASDPCNKSGIGNG